MFCLTILTNILSFWSGRPSSNLKFERAPRLLGTWQCGESCPPAPAPGATPFHPRLCLSPRKPHIMCEHHSLHIPTPSTCPGNSCASGQADSSRGALSCPAWCRHGPCPSLSALPMRLQQKLIMGTEVVEGLGHCSSLGHVH